MKNFLRYTEIIVDGESLDSDLFNIQFQIDRSSSSDSNNAIITILHINEDTKNLFKLFSDIQIIAGYKMGIIGLLFSGTIDELQSTKNNLEIVATEGNAIYTNTIVNESFTPNTKASDIVKKIIGDNGLQLGHILIPNDFQYYRGRYFTETLKDSLNKIASDVNCIWYEKKGLIYFHPDKEELEKTLLNANSGLLEFNKKNEDEYIIISKLNHTLDEGTIVIVEYDDNNSIEVLISAASHYSSDFTTKCEVMFYE